MIDIELQFCCEINVGSREAGVHWSVFDGVKFIPAKPDALMAEINSAIAAIELARATAHLNNSPASPPKNKSHARTTASVYDACIHDEDH